MKHLAVATVLVIARVAGAASFHALPEVAVIAAPGPGSVTLANDTDTAIAVDKVVADPTCDAAVTAMPLGPFVVAPHDMASLALACKPHAPGIARCVMHARDAANQPLLDFEVACLYAGAATLATSTTSVAFGSTVTVGGIATQAITITNQGTANETIGKLFFQLTDLAGNFTIGSPCNPDARDCDAGIAGVSVGGEVTVEIECTPHAPGLHTAQLWIASDSGQRLAAPIAISCMAVTDPVNPVLLASPSPVELGSVDVLTGLGAASVALQNVGGGTGTLGISDIRVVDAGNGAALDWTVVTTGKCSGAPCKLSPGDELRLAIAFDPSAIGVRSATLLVAFTDPVARSRAIPLHGTGLGATLQLIGPPAIDFGTLPIGVAQAVTVQLVNTGNRTVSDVTLTGDGGAFAMSPKTVALAHAAPVAITITCQPQAAGTTTAMLQASAPDVLSGSPIAVAVTCKGTTSPLYASPSTILLGEVRVGSMPAARPIQIMGTGTISAAHLAMATPNLVLQAPPLPAPSPLELQLQLAPTMPAAMDPLATILVDASSGDQLAIPVSGSVVTATYAVPPIAALGTYCIGQPTTPSTITLASTGSGTLALQTPQLLAGNASPFELALIAPTLYPELLAPLHGATIAVTPDRQTAAGTQTDQLIWTTDVAGMTTAMTKITAAFVDSGGAIAPAALGFGKVAIHTMTPGQRITVQNCNNSASLRLDTPHLALPFSLDAPGEFPRTLLPNETVSFSVSFSPLVVRAFAETMTITSETLATPLAVALSGEGITTPDPATDAGDAGPPKDDASACGCSGSRGWPSVLAIGAALAVLLRRRRR